MFVEALKRQNPALISAALSLWQQGKIAPDSWVIDVDQILENGKRLIETARLYGIELYLMTKQFGRNPWLAEKLLALGYSGIVAVDYKEARVMRRAGLPVAHQGHLVQIPCHQVADAVEQGTDVITVFTLDKAREVSAAAVTIVVVMRNMRWCLRQKIKRLLKPISKLWMTAVSTTPCRWQASFR